MESIFFGNKCTNVSKVKANVSYINILFVYIYICFIVFLSGLMLMNLTWLKIDI